MKRMVEANDRKNVPFKKSFQKCLMQLSTIQNCRQLIFTDRNFIYQPHTASFVEPYLVKIICVKSVAFQF